MWQTFSSLTQHNEVDSKPVEQSVGAGDEGDGHVETEVGEDRGQDEEKTTKHQTTPASEQGDEDQASWNKYISLVKVLQYRCETLT